jgi:hypothetical protein
VTLIVPVEVFLAALAFADVPPVMFPVMFTVPEEELITESVTVAVTFPVMFKIPALFAAPLASLALPEAMFPVMFRVPVELFITAAAVETVPPVQFPTIVPTAGDEAVNCRQLREMVVDLLVTLAVSVTPSLSVKIPVPAFETSSQVAFAVMVIVWPVDARASSPTVGITPPVHVAPALKLPLAAEVISAMD